MKKLFTLIILTSILFACNSEKDHSDDKTAPAPTETPAPANDTTKTIVRINNTIDSFIASGHN